MPSNLKLNVFAKQATIRRTDTVAKNLFTLPANAVILYFLVDVDTAFNSSGTDFLDIGKSGNANFYANDVDLSAIGQIMVQESNLGDIGSSVLQITGIFVQSVADATAGVADVTCVFGHYSNL